MWFLNLFRLLRCEEGRIEFAVRAICTFAVSVLIGWVIFLVPFLGTYCSALIAKFGCQISSVWEVVLGQLIWWAVVALISGYIDKDMIAKMITKQRTTETPARHALV